MWHSDIDDIAWNELVNICQNKHSQKSRMSWYIPSYDKFKKYWHIVAVGLDDTLTK